MIPANQMRRKSTVTRMLVWLLLSAVVGFLGIATVEASHDSSNGNPFQPSPQHYTFSQQISLDESILSDPESSSLADDTNVYGGASNDEDGMDDEDYSYGHGYNYDQDYYNDDNYMDSDDSSVVDCALLYSGGVQVSSQAMMISGGDSPSVSSSSMSSEASMQSASAFFLGLSGFDEMEDDESDDDEDDDEDDGHSSMLSNASLKRTNRSNMPASRDSYRGQQSHQSSTAERIDRSPVPVSAMRRQIQRHYNNNRNSNKKGIIINKALLVRGGDGATVASAAMGSEFAKRLLVAALVTLVFEAISGHFLEFVKIVMQTSTPGTTYTDVVKLITAEKGIVGIWDGFVPWGVVQALAKGGVFGLAHAIATSILSPMADRGTIPLQLALTLAGGIGGGFQGFVLSPTLLLKTRVMTNPVFREKISLLRTTLLSLRIGFDVVRDEGMLALMKGSGVFATKRVFDWSTRYFFSDLFERLILGQKSPGVTTLTAMEKIFASLLGGTASTISTLPLDVLVAKTQDAKKAGVKVSPLKMFMNDVKEKGWAGVRNDYLMGFEARLAHVCLTTVAMKTVVPLTYDALFKTAAPGMATTTTPVGATTAA